MSYHPFLDDAGFEYGSFELFSDADGKWFWWPCQPDCLPDTDFPNGPFDTELEAYHDARHSGGPNSKPHHQTDFEDAEELP